jgi:uncharacterized iron-regulated membrane protein
MLGVGTAALSITGVVIWWRKQAAYARRAQRHLVKSDAVTAG